MLISVISSFISVRLSRPYSFFILRNSSLATIFNLASLAKISSNPAIILNKFLTFYSNSTTSVFVNLYNCNTTIASA